MGSGSTRLVLNSQLSHRLFVRQQTSCVVSASHGFLKKKEGSMYFKGSL